MQNQQQNFNKFVQTKIYKQYNQLSSSVKFTQKIHLENFNKEKEINMFGSIQEFIEFTHPDILLHIPTQQNEQQQIIDKKQTNKKRVNSNLHEYQPTDKSFLLARFNLKNQTHKKNMSYLNQSKIYRAQSQRKSLSQHMSLFGKHQITKDYIAKSELKRKHTLLRAIIRTNQKQDENQGMSDYDQSFKRLYEKFQSIYAKPIIECRNFVINQKDHLLPVQNSIQINKKVGSSLNNKKRIQYQNCLSWARKHKKKGKFYEQKLGKHQKQKKQQSLNMGHSMMTEVERKLRTLSFSHRLQ